jgi:hypothetical protein
MIVQIDGNSTRLLLRLNQDPNLPVAHQNLTMTGFEITDPSDPDSESNILQEINDLEYLPNDICAPRDFDLNATYEDSLSTFKIVDELAWRRILLSI